MKAVLLNALCVNGVFLAPESTVDLPDSEFARLEEMGLVREADRIDMLIEAEKPKRGRTPKVKPEIEDL